MFLKSEFTNFMRKKGGGFAVQVVCLQYWNPGGVLKAVRSVRKLPE
jgi:hypothetical protein